MFKFIYKYWKWLLGILVIVAGYLALSKANPALAILKKLFIRGKEEREEISKFESERDAALANSQTKSNADKAAILETEPERIAAAVAEVSDKNEALSKDPEAVNSALDAVINREPRKRTRK